MKIRRKKENKIKNCSQLVLLLCVLGSGQFRLSSSVADTVLLCDSDWCASTYTERYRMMCMFIDGLAANTRRVAS